MRLSTAGFCAMRSQGVARLAAPAGARAQVGRRRRRGRTGGRSQRADEPGEGIEDGGFDNYEKAEDKKKKKVVPEYGRRRAPARRLRCRAFIMELFVEEATRAACSTPASASSSSRRKGNFELVLGFEYENLSPDDGFWLEKGDDAERAGADARLRRVRRASRGSPPTSRSCSTRPSTSRWRSATAPASASAWCWATCCRPTRPAPGRDISRTTAWPNPATACRSTTRPTCRRCSRWSNLLVGAQWRPVEKLTDQRRERHAHGLLLRAELDLLLLTPSSDQPRRLRISPTRRVTFSASKCSASGMEYLREAPTMSFHSSGVICPCASRWATRRRRRSASALGVDEVVRLDLDQGAGGQQAVEARRAPRPGRRRSRPATSLGRGAVRPQARKRAARSASSRRAAGRGAGRRAPGAAPRPARPRSRRGAGARRRARRTGAAGRARGSRARSSSRDMSPGSAW